MIALHLCILIFSIYLFISGKKIFSLLIFFFYLTDGLQLVPEVAKGMTSLTMIAGMYALIMGVVSLFYKQTYNGFKYKSVIYVLAIFLLFFFIDLFVNLFIFGVPILDIVTTSYYYWLLLIILPFRLLSADEVTSLKRILFFIVLAQSVLFIIQVFSGIQLLTGFISGKLSLGFFSFKRCYNWPFLLLYFVFFAYFSNPLKGKAKIISQVIVTLAFVLPLHRSFLMSFFLLLAIGTYISTENKKAFLRKALIFAICLSPVFALLLIRFDDGTAGSADFTVLFSDYTEFDPDDLRSQTMYYRAAHCIERFLYISEDLMNSIFGYGFWSDNNQMAINHTNFLIIPSNEYGTNDMYFFTPDIAWSMFFIRLGYVGTILYVVFYFTLFAFFVKQVKTDKKALVNVLLLTLVFITSFSSDQMHTIYAFVPALLDFITADNEAMADALPIENEYLTDNPILTPQADEI